ncbi:amidohydrolase [Stappia sp. 28M-7]|uniref:amidohydrolase family protein n=1 Tax=Stappia sp. 28M-7 TaxID=2762596 RepID=UPI00163D07A1|nr:amidohydrolase family protein [Stappia sp. 28M-7]MBC2860820.1 amidohydrolase family protein [Stappia sp. 28M-7]
MIRFDCHVHVYEEVTATRGARYVPAVPAPLAGWQAGMARHGLSGGVIVQVSFLGFDNSQLLDALSRLDPQRFAGVAVVPDDVEAAALDTLVAAGIRGIRWNLVRGAPLPDLESPAVAGLLQHLRERGLHVEIQLEGPRLPTIVGPLLSRGVTVVVDHFGLPDEADPARDPWLCALAQAGDVSRLFVKFSAPYRSPVDVAPHARALLDLLPPDHVVWGTDWPHTQHEAIIDYDRAAVGREAFGIGDDAAAVKALYGLSLA